MTITATYTADGASIVTEIDGLTFVVPDEALAEMDGRVPPALRAWLLDGGTISPYFPPPVDLAAYAAAKRYAVEVGGVVVGGLPICTDRETQSMLGRVVQLLDKGMLEAPLNIKTPGGFIALTKEQIETIGAAVAQHVQDSFDVEGQVLAGIANDSIVDTAGVDAAPWPPNT